MSLNVNRTYVTVWDVVVEDKFVKANLSTAKKDPRAESGYTYMRWHTRFVGDAVEKAKELTDKERIVINSARLENYYDRDEKKLYLTLVVFDFDIHTPEVHTADAESSESEE